MSSFDYSIKEKYKLIAWPTPQDYQEAIQSPAQTLSDETLKSGETELNALGLPRPRTGNFASVYRVKCRDKDYAVRFFLNNITDQDERYRALSSAITGDDLEYTVDFEYKPDGIRVHGNWYPSLKMLWVEGEPLDEYVRRIHDSQEKMMQLLEQFTQMMEALRAYGIAHGDLQHGNILVTKDGLRLVDYDGMFVPALSGHGSNELGHRNYQHPGRSREHFGPYLDNFSAWAIYAALEAVTIDPSTWEILRGGDECLLFRAADFQSPGDSRAFALLEGHPCDVIRKRAAQLQSFLQVSPDQIPHLAYDADTRAQIETERKKHYHQERWYEQSRVFFEKGEPLISPLNSQERERESTAQEMRHGAQPPKPIPPQALKALVTLICTTLAFIFVVGYWSGLQESRNSTPSATQAETQSLPIPLTELPLSLGMKLGTAEEQRWNRTPNLPVYLGTSKNGNSIVILTDRRTSAEPEALQYVYDGKLKGLTLDYPPGRCQFAKQPTNYANVTEPNGRKYFVAWQRAELDSKALDIQDVIIKDFDRHRSDDGVLLEASSKQPPSAVPNMSIELQNLGKKAADSNRYEDALLCYYATYQIERAAEMPGASDTLLGCLKKMRACAKALNNNELLAALSHKSIPYYANRAEALASAAEFDSRLGPEIEDVLANLVDLYADANSIDQPSALHPIDRCLSVLAQKNYTSYVSSDRLAFEVCWEKTAYKAIVMMWRGTKQSDQAGHALLLKLKNSYAKAPKDSRKQCLSYISLFGSSVTVENFIQSLKSLP